MAARSSSRNGGTASAVRHRTTANGTAGERATADAIPMAPDRPASEDAPPRMRHRWTPGRMAVLALALLFFTTPALAYLAGARAQQIENRALTPRPSLSEGWQVFPQLNRWTSDHLPLRSNAVSANASIDQGVFDELPAYGTSGRSDVVAAHGGWLFYAQDLAWACTPQASVPSILANANRLASIVRSTGARYVLLVPPDKTSIETAELPSRYPNKACSTAAKQAFWSQIEASPPQGYADLYRPLQQLRAQLGRPVYKSKDTHWAPVSGALYARAVVDAIAPGLWQPKDLVPTGPQKALGDLTRFTGIEADNTFDGYEVRRPGVMAYPAIPYVPGASGKLGTAGILGRTTGASTLYTGRTLTLADSFNGVSQFLVSPYFARMTSVSINAAPKSPRDVARLILSSKAVVVESVERGLATGRAPLFSTGFLDALQREITAQRRSTP